ncbi:histidine kinase N-terminal 7TM domain-containing protein [Halorientalis pallida]|uniref:histidine kinase n=1 Tax=Halorientalis pallida TaxID=2479928 RepID=A0A498L0G2_9EURY|nr:histidine kinase N-terminal 7TM domain-containing protein [Halorientalis pallida]RXK49213.1 PAS domain-containing protein [Halorientalis pallida]
MVPSRLLLTGLYVVAGLLPVVLFPRVLGNRDKPGAVGLVLLLLGASVWSLGTAVVTMATTMPPAFVGENLTSLGAGILATGWVLVAAEYAGFLVPSRRTVGALLGVGVLPQQVAAWTNPIHHRYYRSLSPSASLTSVSADVGPAFWVFIVVGYTFFAVGFLVFLSEVLTSRSVRRQQSFALLLSTIPTILVGSISVFLVPEVSLSPFSFVGMVFIVTWALFRSDFLDIVPIARQELVENIRDPVVTLDEGGQVIDSNAAARELSPVGPDVTGVPAAEFFPDRTWQRAVRESSPGETDVAVTRDGQDRHFVADVSRLTDARGTERGRLVVLREVTRLKEREQQLRRQNERLDQFASMISHDLRNPLNAAQLRFSLVRDDATEEHAAAVERNLDRMERMIDDMLTVARAGTDVEDTEPVDLPTLVAEAWDTAETDGATLDSDLPATATVEADPSRLRNVFENLFRNAVDHNTAPVTVRVGTHRDGFYVEDDGSGIPDDEREDVFDRGFTTSDDGTGLGLSIVSDIVEGHGWEITVTEGESGGARFEIHTA